MSPDVTYSSKNAKLIITERKQSKMIAQTLVSLCALVFMRILLLFSLFEFNTCVLRYDTSDVNAMQYTYVNLVLSR